MGVVQTTVRSSVCFVRLKGWGSALTVRFVLFVFALLCVSAGVAAFDWRAGLIAFGVLGAATVLLYEDSDATD